MAYHATNKKNPSSYQDKPDRRREITIMTLKKQFKIRFSNEDIYYNFHPHR